LVKAILFIGLVALIALIVNTLVTDFHRFDNSIEREYFLFIIFGLFVYWVSLVVSSRELLKTRNDEN